MRRSLKRVKYLPTLLNFIPNCVSNNLVIFAYSSKRRWQRIFVSSLPEVVSILRKRFDKMNRNSVTLSISIYSVNMSISKTICVYFETSKWRCHMAVIVTFFFFFSPFACFKLCSISLHLFYFLFFFSFWKRTAYMKSGTSCNHFIKRRQQQQ